MTGTPVANRPYDIWAPIKFLDGGKSLGESFSEFRENLDLKNELSERVPAQNAFERSLGSIFSKIRPFTVRETKDSAGIELPEKRIENILVHLEQAQLTLYERFRHELSADVLRGGELVTDDAEDILKRLLRLVQLASNPILVDESYRGFPGKLPAAQMLVQRALGEESKVIVWTNFIKNADWLGREFKDFGSVVVHGDKTIAQRDAALSSFKVDPSVKVLVATPASAKEGLTLTVANHAVFFDRSFSLEDYVNRHAKRTPYWG
jgi:SNF2 family DNA or RNA helicase